MVISIELVVEEILMKQFHTLSPMYGKFFFKVVSLSMGKIKQVRSYLFNDRLWHLHLQAGVQNSSLQHLHLLVEQPVVHLQEFLLLQIVPILREMPS